MKSRKRMALTVAVSLTLVLGSATAANAAEASDPSDEWSAPQSVTFDAPTSNGTVNGSARAAAASKITCTVKTNQGHYSDGSHGVIAKIRASCKGTCGCEPTVSIRVQGLLSYSTTETPLSKYKKVRSTDVTKVFKTDGTPQTTYIPQKGEYGYAKNGWFLATGSLDPADAAAVSSTAGPNHVTDVP